MPLLDRPIIQWVVEEAFACGADDILIITGRHKRAIEDHFDASPELERALEAAGKSAELERVRAASAFDGIHYVRQKEPLGLGHAVLCAKKHIGDEPFLLMLGDDVIVGPHASDRLAKLGANARTVVGVEQIGSDRISKYGVLEPGEPLHEGAWNAKGFVEKPAPADAPSDMGIMGRYWLQPEVFEHLSRSQAGANGEVQLTDSLDVMARAGQVDAATIEGVRLDTGTPESWLESNNRIRGLLES